MPLPLNDGKKNANMGAGKLRNFRRKFKVDFVAVIRI